ncbi:MAG: ribosome silencing factor [Anaerolineae bacterium]
MESLELANRITDVIVDRQGEDVLILDLREVTTFTDYFVICTANSRRQLDALQNAIREEMKQGDDRRLARSFEGDSNSGWILIDFNSVIVHLFSEEMRDYYQLEDLWKNARVVARIK